MKLQMNRISQGEDEVIIRYQKMTEQIEAIAAMLLYLSGITTYFFCQRFIYV